MTLPCTPALSSSTMLERLNTELSVTAVRSGTVELGDGRTLASQVTIWAAGFGVPDLADRSGLRTDAAGRPVNAVYHFGRAACVLSLDSNFLYEDPGSLRYARQFINGRRLRIGHRTVQRRVQRVMDRWNVVGRVALGARAQELGLLDSRMGAEPPLTADRFARTETFRLLPPEQRLRLIQRLGLYGLRLAVELVRTQYALTVSGLPRISPATAAASSASRPGVKPPARSTATMSTCTSALRANPVR